MRCPKCSSGQVSAPDFGGYHRCGNCGLSWHPAYYYLEDLADEDQNR